VPASPFVAPTPPTGPLAPAPVPVAPLFPTGDPGPNGLGPYGPPSPPPGLFTDIELLIIKPSLKNQINSDRPFGTANAGTIPSANLGWTVSPKFEIGDRLPEGLGFFALSYRFMLSDGKQTQVFAGAPFQVHTRLDLNTIDLDYGTAPYEVAPHYELSYRIGARLSDIFFDSSVSTDGFRRQASNNFFGAGPHAQVDATHPLSFLPDVSLFGRLDGAVLIGNIHQHFREDAGGGTSDFVRNRTQSVPTLTIQAGLSYTPSFYKNLHFTTGWQYEHYWFLGQIGQDAAGNFSTSRGELSANSWFLRGQLDF
jgi:hypothetical protein